MTKRQKSSTLSCVEALMAKFDAAELTDQGNRAGSNQDRTVCIPERGIFAVIDGAGGSERGEEAAETLRLALHALPDEKPSKEALLRVMFAAHSQMVAEAKETGKRGYCVATVIWFDGTSDSGEYILAHCGDTRGYRIYEHMIGKLTIDHDAFLDQDISDKDKMSHRLRNVISRSIGSKAYSLDEFICEIDISRGELEVGGRIVLCSDGVTDFITAEQVRSVITAHEHSGATVVVTQIFESTFAAQKRVSRIVLAGDNIGLVYLERTA